MTNNDSASIIPSKTVICVLDDKYSAKAELIAQKTGSLITHELPENGSSELVLSMSTDGVSLIGNGQVLFADFSRMLPRIKRENLKSELLVKASKIKEPVAEFSAVDATAGLGEDAFLLAAAGFSVCMYERDPIIAALLEDALIRGSSIPQTAPTVARMRLIQGDSITALNDNKKPLDLVLLDPMFPSRQKSALIKKKFQLLQQLETPCSDEKELLEAAISARPQKIVIKRPAKSPFLAGCKPDYSLNGSTIRYDCIVSAQKKLI